MNVKLSRNINDIDLYSEDDTLSYPPDVFTDMSFFQQRMRMAEICRAIIDARCPGFPDFDVTDLDKVYALDRLCEQAIAELPPFLQMDGLTPPDAPRHLALQRVHIHMGIHTRRARLHRPFLFHQAENPHCQPSRDQCMRSARIVISLCLELLEGSLSINQSQSSGGPLAYRLGVVISALFTACTIVALVIGQSSVVDGGRMPTAETNDEARRDLEHACRALETAGKRSLFAAELVQNLSDVLAKYRSKNTEESVVESSLMDDPATCSEGVGQVLNPIASMQAEGLKRDSLSDAVADLEFNGLWNEFLGSVPGAEEFDQLFADLDLFNGTNI
jgi:hypothetical protein